jgi:protein involved in polysaccharide export with SLBB domain
MSTLNDHQFSKQAPLVSLLALVLFSLWTTGCTHIVAPIDAIPADRVPVELLVEPTNGTRSLDFARLRRPPENQYLLDKGDVLGIFIDGVLGNLNEAPPIRLPDGVTDLPPAIGYPVPVRDNGTLPLPLIKPIFVKGMTVEEAEAAIRRAYARAGVLQLQQEDDENQDDENQDADKDDADTSTVDISEVRTIVTLMKERTYRVLVVRQDDLVNSANEMTQNGLSVQRSVTAGLGTVLQLPEGKNDVLQALSLTGGLPGFRAKNEVKIYRGGSERDYAEKDSLILEHYRNHHLNRDPCFIPPDLPDVDDAVRIPLRLAPNEVPQFQPQDVILGDGDIVVVESREKEVFYTGGLLGGGEFPLPRDYDLDVLTAMSIAKQGYGALEKGNAGGGFSEVVQSIGNIPPTQLIVLRELPGNRQVAIEVDLTKAINNPKSRILVAPGDKLILRHKPIEEAINFGFGTFFTYGIRQLFSN